ncbi:MAG: tRNA lysidine(34) synthetase TilS [Rhodospirillaceae bacterium]|nr:tRNA lysidine(34) synthetase TilS [Rhodospirillales bacterium]MBT3905220.1 tRNA lysidine(34) synthetase TilS [Rhodospirillaceae bacterium]MBT4703031.1 tRNA lysidine(34) synthetase TilS [Rhodospirillaceae bacterium]MBT5033349.1 tRNA lysidine(34) synthetase TilS [Rhodospirillaceae bacterium]MBT6219193.1 tRNA lysidine(34) synthetase TilS [Rhodospirillaceae bacterium]
MTILSDKSFAHKMAALGPFEAEPHLAIAVSGGGDSMALVLLADQWAKAQGGQVTALTVDHGLRAESAREAAQVATWLQARGIAHEILPWTHPKPRTGVQKAAREARYALMSEWCRRQGVLHLALAHNLEDQAETYLMRLGRGSGVDGLAAMPECLELTDIRLLRPLLDASRQSLRELLEARGQDWVEDPSNENTAYARTRVRALLSPLAGGGISPKRLAKAAARYGSARLALENQTARLLAECVAVYPLGYASLSFNALMAADQEIAYRALSRVLCCIGGRQFGPSVEKLARLYKSLREGEGFRGRSLGGCRIDSSDRNILITREVRSGVLSLVVRPGETIHWDRRFKITLGGVGADETNDNSSSLKLNFLGKQGWNTALQQAPELADHHVAYAAKVSLPALFDGEGICQIPHLGYQRAGAAFIQKSQFCPPNSVSSQGFFLA